MKLYALAAAVFTVATGLVVTHMWEAWERFVDMYDED